MTTLAYKAPLHWPNTKDATKANQRTHASGFPTTLTMRESLAYLEEEVRGLSPQTAILYSNVEQLNNDRLRKKLNNETGVTLELKIAGKNYFLACDRWASMEHNIYALHLAVRNARNYEKWGIGSLEDALYGFASVKAKHDVADYQQQEVRALEIEEWMALLGLGPTATLDDAQATYRRRAKALAEDTDSLIQLNNAMDEARRHLSK